MGVWGMGDWSLGLGGGGFGVMGEIGVSCLYLGGLLGDEGFGGRFAGWGVGIWGLDMRGLWGMGEVWGLGLGLRDGTLDGGFGGVLGTEGWGWGSLGDGGLGFWGGFGVWALDMGALGYGGFGVWDWEGGVEVGNAG